MRILQLVTSTQRRGAEVFAAQLAEVLHGRGHHVSTLALQSRGHDTDLPFDTVSGPRFGPRALSRLVKESRSHDVVVAHGGSTLAPVAFAARVARRPFVYRNIGDPAYWAARRGARLRVGAPLRTAAHVMALYDSAAKFLVEHYGLDRRRVTVARNAVDPRRFTAKDPAATAAARTSLGIPSDARVVGYLGALSSEKRPGIALDLATSLEDVVVVVAGTGPLRDELERRTRDELGSLDGRVRLVGEVTEPTEVLAAMDVLIIPSRTEGIPGVLVEAALTGTPVVATDVGGVGETVRALGCGEAFAVDDLSGFVSGVRRVLDEPGSYLADRAVVIASHGLEAIADIWESVLTEVTTPDTVDLRHLRVVPAGHPRGHRLDGR